MLIRVDFDVARFAARLDAIHTKQVPFAVARALTLTAQQARDQITAELPSIFDRPTPFTEKGFAIKSATKTDFTSAVFAKDIQAQYLLHEEIGGERTPAENTRIKSRALVLPAKIERDAFGGIPSGAIKALRQAVNDEATGNTRRAKAKRAAASAKASRERISYSGVEGIAYLPGKGPKGGPGGFFLRLPGHHISRLVSFEGKASYRPRFHYRERITATVQKSFVPNLIKALREAVATSR